ARGGCQGRAARPCDGGGNGLPRGRRPVAAEAAPAVGMLPLAVAEQPDAGGGRGGRPACHPTTVGQRPSGLASACFCAESGGVERRFVIAFHPCPRRGRTAPPPRFRATVPDGPASPGATRMQAIR